MSNPQTPNDGERRELLIAATRFGAAAAAFGLTLVADTGEAAQRVEPAKGLPKERATALLAHAIRTGNMEEAIDRYGRGATLVQLAATRALTRRDLEMLRTLQGKLHRLAEAGLMEATVSTFSELKQP